MAYDLSTPRIGVDESGKGDFFGPLVIAACYVGPEHLAELEGVRDSKQLTDPQALRLAGIIRRTCPHAMITIGPAKYNELYARILNLNRLLAWGHAQAIENCLEKVPNCGLVISDQFADPKGLRSKLKERGRGVELVSMVRGERDIAVAAASILARAEFLTRLNALGERFAMTLPKGAGPPVDAAGRRFLATHGADQLKEVAKLHFKTTQKIGAGSLLS